MITVTLIYTEDTKNKFKYQETPETNFIGTLYVSKLAFGGKKPEKIKIIIETEE